MELLITILASQLPMISHLVVDHHRMKTGKPIMHKRGAVMVLLLSVMLGLIVDEKHFLQFMFLALCTHFALFDILWNKIEGHKWNYLGTESNPDRAWTDKMWSKLPEWLQAVLRIAVLAGGWIIYLKMK